MTEPYDVVITGDDRPLTAHATDCASLDMLRAMGVPMMTMIECQAPLPDDLDKHHCLD